MFPSANQARMIQGPNCFGRKRIVWYVAINYMEKNRRKEEKTGTLVEKLLLDTLATRVMLPTHAGPGTTPQDGMNVGRLRVYRQRAMLGWLTWR